ncbi:MAG: glycosyltransferase family 2 protein [Xanthomonadales bacterium]|nr:glycosyltransferase family 2 protein [Xanthomonadales bacterium]
MIIVAYHSGPVLADAVRHALNQARVERLYVVDNSAGADASLQPLRRHPDPRVAVLDPGCNLGFGAACNLAAAESQSPYLLFLNPDVLLPDGLTAELWPRVREHPRLGALGVAMAFPDGRIDPASARRDPTPARALATLLRLDRLGLAEGVALRGLPPGVTPVDAISGALMLMPKAAFEAVGGFDTRYFLHAEDLDLCRRLRNVGYQVLVDLGLRAVHLKGTSSRREPLRVLEWKHQSLQRYFLTHDAPRLQPWQRQTVLAAEQLRYGLARSILRLRQRVTP